MSNAYDVLKSIEHWCEKLTDKEQESKSYSLMQNLYSYYGGEIAFDKTTFKFVWVSKDSNVYYEKGHYPIGTYGNLVPIRLLTLGFIAHVKDKACPDVIFITELLHSFIDILMYEEFNSVNPLQIQYTKNVIEYYYALLDGTLDNDSVTVKLFDAVNNLTTGSCNEDNTNVSYLKEYSIPEEANLDNGLLYYRR